MEPPSKERLKTIRFQGQLLPPWARLLDLASRLCPTSEATRHWFSTLTNSNGVDDARTALAHCELLRRELQDHREQVLGDLRREHQDAQALQVFGAWVYALDTIIQESSGRQTCSWLVDGAEQSGEHDWGGGGDITSRRV